MSIKLVFEDETDTDNRYSFELYANDKNRLWISISANNRDFYDGGFLTLNIEDAKKMQEILSESIAVMERNENG